MSMAMINRYTFAQNSYPAFQNARQTNAQLPRLQFAQKDQCAFHLNQVRPQKAIPFAGNEHYAESGLRKATAMFREGETLELATYLLRTIHAKNSRFEIADYGCSSGEEAYSLAMLLAAANLRYKITGYDFAGPALYNAQQGQIGINNQAEFVSKQHKDLSERSSADPSNIDIAFNFFHRKQDAQFEDEFLNADSLSKMDEDQKRYYGLFHQHFKMQPNGSSPSRTLYTLRSDKDLKCSFKEGDIRNILSTRGSHSTDMILFRNALYQLIGTPDSRDQKEVKLLLDNLFKQINQTLKPFGLLVLGQNENSQHRQQKLVDQALKEAGFERNSIIPQAPIYIKVNDV